MIIDSHCHLDYLEREGGIIADVLERAKANKVSGYVTIGTKWHEREVQLSLANRFEDVYCTIGTHPHEAESETQPSLDEFLQILANPKVVGIGETGLDYYYNHSPKDKQIDSFLFHIEAARISQLPIIIHCRDADDEMIEILTHEQKKGQFNGLVHCFSGTKALAEAAISLGMSLSISGIITFKKADDLRDIVKDIPLTHLLVETDSPFLAPLPYRGKPNEPAYTFYTAQYLSNFFGMELEEFAKITTQNCRKIFPKANFNVIS